MTLEERARQQIDVLLQVELNTGIVREINAPLTPIAEQHRIVSEIEKHCPRLEAGIGSLKRVQQAALCLLRQSILHRTFVGAMPPQPN